MTARPNPRPVAKLAVTRPAWLTRDPAGPATGLVDRVATFALVAAFVAVAVASLAAPVRRTGDAQQYVAMAVALGHLRPPSLDPAEVAAFKQWMAAQPADSGYPGAQAAIDQGSLRSGGRQEFSHFWLFPLAAAPFVRAAEALGQPLGLGFTLLNLLVLGSALALVAQSTHPAVSLLLLATPLVWFVDKAQVEVFTVAMLAVAVSLLIHGDPLLAGLALAIAAAQNLPLAVGVGLCWLIGTATALANAARGQEGRLPIPSRRTLALVAATVAVLALHPAYYLWRLGVVTPQERNGGFAVRLPDWERYLSAVIDPGIGLLPFAPTIALFGAWGVFALVCRRDQADTVDRLALTALVCALLAGWLLFVFAQTTNVNSGGTIWVSRYALWLLPLAIPCAAAVAVRPAGRLALLLAALAALPISILAFDPALPERYVVPSPQMAWLNDSVPGWYRQPPEVFYERMSATDGGVRGSAATPGCQTLLIAAVNQSQPCSLTPEERAAADGLLASGWSSVWVTRTGTSGLGRAAVTGAERAGS